MQNLRKSKFVLVVFSWFLFLSLINVLLFGFSHTPTWQDAAQYSAYAQNLVLGNGYSLDGVTFSNYREPGYPIFLSFVYIVFGIENITAVTLVQGVLLALIALISFLVFQKMNYARGGVVLGTLISVFPSYGYYAHEIGSEMLFTFLITLTAYVLFSIVQQQREKFQVHMLWYVALGVVVGYGILVRVQFLFFLPFILLLSIVFFRNYISWKGLCVSLALSLGLVMGWASLCAAQSGSFSITEGRPELVLYVRAVRAELTYAELSKYYVAWVKRRVTAEYMDPMLRKADLVGLYPVYLKIATTSDLVMQIKSESIQTIMTHPAHYLAGNVVEIAKLYYIEYLYTPYLGKYVRASMYFVLYLWVVFGIWSLYTHRKVFSESMWVFVVVVSGLVFYNAVFLSFFDTIPRYNTPFLVFFLAIGVLGLYPFWYTRASLRE